MVLGSGSWGRTQLLSAAKKAHEEDVMENNETGMKDGGEEMS